MARSARLTMGIVALLLLSTIALYGRSGGHEFLNYDDDIYITENTHLRDGLSGRGLLWAFTSLDANWHPLTWLSHMLDVELFGLDPRPHHLHNVLLHALNAALLFLALRRLSGALWSAALVAALFAFHPLRVESVAWASERKDLLAGLFWMLTLLAYARYVRAPGRGGALLLSAVFALGLLAKPMLVSLPAVLLLLDFWPLARFGPASGGRGAPGRLVLEKIPLLLLAAGSSLMTLLAQRAGNAVAYAQEYPLGARVSNALASCWAYLLQMLWPAGLTVFYPFQGWEIPLWRSAVAGLLLAAVTAGLLLAARRRGVYLVGWLWYLVALLPVIGLLQVGGQARADRYTYLPLIGVSLMVVWGLGELVRRWPRLLGALVALSFATLVALAARTWDQLGNWRTSITLFTHAVQVEPESWIANNNLGNALLKAGRIEEGQASVTRAYSLNPYLRFDLLIRTGDALARRGQIAEALASYRKARELIPYDRMIGRKIADLERRQGR